MPLFAQQALQPVPRFPLHRDPLTITQPAGSAKPFTVAGPAGAILGEQNGNFEQWSFPVKVLSHFSITAELQDYPVPIDVAPLAASIEVAPAITTITYSHAAFTIRQRMFAPRASQTAATVVFFEIQSVRPLSLTFRFRPEMLRMWPAPSFGTPSAEWVIGQGVSYYVLHTDNPEVSAAVAMPRSRPGILAPYQERPQTHPVELKLAFDPKTDAGLVFPLLVLTGQPSGYADRLRELNTNLPRLYAETENYWTHFFDTRLTSETPDPQFDRALRWAQIAIDQGRVRFHDETGLIAGYYASGDSARPGFAWFFGRDALWTSFAVNGYGDFPLTRSILEFLTRRQRSDGKIMHEFSQAADLVDWKSLPYFYAAADATPLFVIAMEDYVRTSADTTFLRTHWQAVRSAYAFTRAHDSDGDGIYENSQGTGWVESWPSGMPHQEIYLAALDQQSADAMSRLAAIMHDGALADSARQQAARIRAALESEYHNPNGFYAFSRNADGTLDHTATIYPAVAWWTGRLALKDPAMFDRWGSPEFSTDWGTRDVSDQTAFYDPISYHQGSVWPLFTGWVALAEYRAGRPLSGFLHLMQNARLSWFQDPGAVTELLSGEFFQPLGRSSSHQIWSSAMVVTPALRGLFGLDWDALHKTLRLAPSLPASWNTARLRNVPLGAERIDLELTRESSQILVRARSAAPAVFCLVSQATGEQDCHSPAATVHELALPLPGVELEVSHELPPPGAITSQLKCVSERRSLGEYQIQFTALAGSAYELPIRLNRPNVKIAGGQLDGGRLRIHFPAGSGYQPLTVTFTW